MDGRVLGLDGQGIPAAEVRLERPDGSVQRTFSDAEGVFHLSDCAEQPAILRVRAARMVAATRTLQGLPDDWRQVVRLADAGAVRGRLTDAGGDAVAGVDVFAFYEHDDRRNAQRARTDDKGHYRIEHVALGPVTVIAWAGQHAEQRSLWLRDEAVVDLRLDRGEARRQRIVVEGLEQPVPGAYVQVLNTRTLIGDGIGRYPLDSTNTVDFPVTASCLVSASVPGHDVDPGGMLTSGRSRQLRFRASASPRREAPRRMKGSVQTIHGKPAAVHDLLLLRDLSGRVLARIEVGRAGNFEFDVPEVLGEQFRIGLPLGRWELLDDLREIRDGCYWIPVWSGDTGVRLFAQETVELDAPLMLPDGTLASLTEVVLVHEDQPQREFTRLVSDRAGQLHALLPRGDYRLSTTTDDGAHLQAELPLDPGIVRRQIDLQPHAGSRVGGVLLDCDGEPLPGARLLLASWEVHGKPVDPGERQVVELRTGRDGRFGTVLQRGQWSIAVRDLADYATELVLVDKHAKVDLRIAPR